MWLRSINKQKESLAATKTKKLQYLGQIIKKLREVPITLKLKPSADKSSGKTTHRKNKNLIAEKNL